MKLEHRALKSCISYILRIALIVILILSVQAHAIDKNEEMIQKETELQKIVNSLKQAVKMEDFTILKPYAPGKTALYWAECDSDVSFDVTLNIMLRELSKKFKKANIKVNENPKGGLIETEGWAGEYPFLYFQFTETAEGWKWLGVCTSADRLSEFLSSKEKKG